MEMNKYGAFSSFGKEEDYGGDEVMLHIPKDSSSEEEENGDDEESANEQGENDKGVVSSQHVSTLMEPSSMREESST